MACSRPSRSAARCLERRQLRAAVRVKCGSQRAGDLARAQRPEHRHLRRLESLRDPLGLLDQCVRSRAPTALAMSRVHLDRDQDLVLLGDLGGRVDQLEVGLDHRGAARRDRRIACRLQPPGELVALGGGGALDPLQPAHRRAGRAGQHEPPPGKASLLRLGIQQRESNHAARQHRGQAPAVLLADHADRAVAVADLCDRHAAELARHLRARLRDRPVPGCRVLVGEQPARRQPRAEPAAAQQSSEGERGDHRSPFLGRSTAQGRNCDQHERSERDRREHGPRRGGGVIDDRDRQQRTHSDRRRLAGAHRPQDPAPLERPKAIAQPLAHGAHLPLCSGFHISSIPISGVSRYRTVSAAGTLSGLAPASG